MNDCTDDCDLADICSQRHWSIYWIIILCSSLFVTGRIMTLGIAVGPSEKTPFMSANDRSRWATVRALGDENRYEIDNVISDQESGINWDTIDKVQHVGKDGQLHYYSSKPPLLPALVSLIYRSAKSVSGFNLNDDPLIIVRLVLLIVSAAPWLVYLWLLAKIMEMIQVRDWTRYFIVATAGFATYLSTFTISLNNHLPAAISVMAVLYCLTRIVIRSEKNWFVFATAGFAAAFAAANELPALSFFAMAGLICFLKSPGKFAIGFLPASVLVAAAFFGTNYAAHDDWLPPYAHRSDGSLIKTLAGEFENELDNNVLPPEFVAFLGSHGLKLPKIALAEWPFAKSDGVTRWKISGLDHKKFTILSERGSNQFEIHGWDNWYDYETSYWVDGAKSTGKKSLVDQGQPDSVLYLFHVLFGHHGIFSLTPIWLFSLAGMVGLFFTPRLQLKWLATVTFAITVIVIGFYIYWVSDHDRNYGGRTSAFRWGFWLAPMWLISMAPVVDWLGTSRRGRAVCYVFLMLSAISAQYSIENPFVHPWLYEAWDWTGLPK